MTYMMLILTEQCEFSLRINNAIDKNAFVFEVMTYCDLLWRSQLCRSCFIRHFIMEDTTKRAQNVILHDEIFYLIRSWMPFPGYWWRLSGINRQNCQARPYDADMEYPLTYRSVMVRNMLLHSKDHFIRLKLFDHTKPRPILFQWQTKVCASVVIFLPLFYIDIIYCWTYSRPE